MYVWPGVSFAPARRRQRDGGAGAGLAREADHLGLEFGGPGVRVGVADGAFRQLRKRRAVPLRYYGARRIDQLRRDDVGRAGIGPGIDVGVERHATVGCELRVRQRDVVLVEVHA